VPDGIPVAFYAPLKGPDHPSPSGDRTMARLLLKALGRAGFEPSLASELRSWDGTGDPSDQERVRRAAEAEAHRVIQSSSLLPAPERPRLWFTYHLYYKAPDWIGPRVSEALGIPYLVAEGSRAGKRAGGPWALGHWGAEAALDRADAIFVMTAADREALERAKPARQRLLDLPPFLDAEDWGGALAEPREVMVPQLRDGLPVRLLTVAMMRHGDKLASYRMLAEALARVTDDSWRLDIVGDGEAREQVEQLFASFGRRVEFLGRIEDRSVLARLYAEADLFGWPAVNEAYGMALLEAQAFGCPVLAGAYGGVASVVEDGRTGVLVHEPGPAAFADALVRLLRDPSRRVRLGASARDFVRRERGVGRAAERLRGGLLPLLSEQFAL
jgi:glycosyltransferase involved in cell wall biosynthesis